MSSSSATYWLADSKKAREAVQYLQRFVDHLVDVTLYPAERAGEKQKINEQEQQDHEKYTLLKALAKDTQDPVELRDQVLFMLTASRDITAALLSWMFPMLAKYPPVLQKLRAAIIEEFGTEESPNNISFNTLKKCHYLRWVMFETLRLYPPGPLNLRVAARDATLPTGGGPDRKSPISVRNHHNTTLPRGR
jgi:cytochrome P450